LGLGLDLAFICGMERLDKRSAVECLRRVLESGHELCTGSTALTVTELTVTELTVTELTVTRTVCYESIAMLNALPRGPIKICRMIGHPVPLSANLFLCHSTNIPQKTDLTHFVEASTRQYRMDIRGLKGYRQSYHWVETPLFFKDFGFL